MPIHHLSVDIETYSSVPIAKSGLYKYVQSPDFEILLLAYSLDGAPVEALDLAADAAVPPVLWDALWDPCCVKHAYNAAFEWYCLSKWAKLEDPTAWLPQWHCTMLHGLYCGYTAGLDATGKALGLPQEKQKLATGKALIKYFCTPCTKTKSNGGRTRNLPHHDPAKWELFKEYCRQDVVTEMEIGRRLSGFPVPGSVQAEWVRDQVINARGVAMDQGLVSGALYCGEAAAEAALSEARELTGLSNPNSREQLLTWLQAKGVPIADLRGETVEDALGHADSLDPDAARVLGLRQELSKTSTKKYDAIVSAMCSDGRTRGLLQFYGANRTGRWAGRLVQVQNLPRTYLHGGMLDLARSLVRRRDPDALRLIFGSVPDTLSQLVRTAFVPRAGCSFVDADFSAIEARVIAWLAGEEWVLQVFRTHGRIYEAAASQMFGVPLERIVKGNPDYALRQKGKVATLALGYQGGSGALVAMGALRMGLSEEELPDIVSRWRQANPAIVRCWKALEQASIQAIETGRACTTHGLVFTREADIENGQDFLTIQLPSGRKLYYAKPHLGINQWGGKAISYYGMNQASKKWEPTDTYGGKITENCVQAIARDCLAVNIERLEQAGYPVVFHIHDEVVLEVEKGRADLDAAIRIMSEPIPWAPGLPMAADGWVGDYFTKD
ncbi:DNA polymerase [Intestinibacillus massiliensis]